MLNSTIEKGGEGCALDAAVTQLRDDGRAFKYETDAVVADAIVTGKEAAGLSHQDAVTKFSLSCGEREICNECLKMLACLCCTE